jgi:hypothetical protein
MANQSKEIDAKIAPVWKEGVNLNDYLMEFEIWAMSRDIRGSRKAAVFLTDSIRNRPLLKLKLSHYPIWLLEQKMDSSYNHKDKNVEKAVRTLEAWPRFVSHLKSITLYDSPKAKNAVHTAFLRMSRKGNESMEAYLARFESSLAEVRKLGFAISPECACGVLYSGSNLDRSQSLAVDTHFDLNTVGSDDSKIEELLKIFTRLFVDRVKLDEQGDVAMFSNSSNYNSNYNSGSSDSNYNKGFRNGLRKGKGKQGKNNKGKGKGQGGQGHAHKKKGKGKHGNKKGQQHKPQHAWYANDDDAWYADDDDAGAEEEPDDVYDDVDIAPKSSSL